MHAEEFDPFEELARSKTKSFVTDFLRTLRGTLCFHDDATCKLRQELDKIIRNDEDAQKKIRDARREVGKQNDAYLQTGIAMLWTGFDTSMDRQDVQRAIFPGSLRTSGVASIGRDRVLLTRFVRELTERKKREKKALDDATKRAVALVDYLLLFNEIRSYITLACKRLEQAVGVAALLDEGVKEAAGRIASLLSNHSSGSLSDELNNSPGPPLLRGFRIVLDLVAALLSPTASIERDIEQSIRYASGRPGVFGLQVDTPSEMGALNDSLAKERGHMPTDFDGKYYIFGENGGTAVSLPSGQLEKLLHPFTAEISESMKALGDVDQNLTTTAICATYTCVATRLICTPGPHQTLSKNCEWYKMPSVAGSKDLLAHEIAKPFDNSLSFVDESSRIASREDSRATIDAVRTDGSELATRRAARVLIAQNATLSNYPTVGVSSVAVQWMPLRRSEDDSAKTQLNLQDADVQHTCTAAVLGAMSHVHHVMASQTDSPTGKSARKLATTKEDQFNSDEVFDSVHLAAVLKARQVVLLAEIYHGEQRIPESLSGALKPPIPTNEDMVWTVDLPKRELGNIDDINTYIQQQTVANDPFEPNRWRKWDAKNDFSRDSYDSLKDDGVSSLKSTLDDFTTLDNNPNAALKAIRALARAAVGRAMDETTPLQGTLGQALKAAREERVLCQGLANCLEAGSLALVATHSTEQALLVLDEARNSLDQQQRQQGSPHLFGSLADAPERSQREAVLQDAMRELVVSGDPLFAFLKNLAGLLHEDVTSIIRLEDRGLEASQRASNEQRRETVRSTIQFGQRIVDGLITSVFKESSFRVDFDASTADGSSAAREATRGLVVVSGDTIERIKQLASDNSTTGFFDAQVQLQRMLEQRRGREVDLEELIGQVRSVVEAQLRSSLQMIDATHTSDQRGALDFLAQPRNSLIIRLRNETFSAIRMAYDSLCTELMAQRRSGRITREPWSFPTAWDCVEGPWRPLCDQFAALAAYTLAQSRVFSSAASAYVSQSAQHANTMALRFALQKTVRRAIEFSSGAPRMA